MRGLGILERKKKMQRGRKPYGRERRKSLGLSDVKSLIRKGKKN